MTRQQVVAVGRELNQQQSQHRAREGGSCGLVGSIGKAGLFYVMLYNIHVRLISAVKIWIIWLISTPLPVSSKVSPQEVSL